MKLKKTFVLAALAISGVTAHAFPIAAPGTEGLLVIVSSAADVVATYQGNSASYSNDLYLERDAAGNPGIDGILGNDLFIFNNHGNTPLDTANLGSFTVGTELVFRLHVNNTGYDYFTGAASRNPDANIHARVENGWMPSETLVSFEDLYNGPFHYNDLSFSFTSTRGGTGTVPDAMNTGLWFGIVSIATLLGVRRRRIA